jgi:carboxylesterase type B
MKFDNQLVSLLLTYPLYGTAVATWQIGQEVNTASGLVKGHAAKLDGSVSEYLGIPWASPPVNGLRFMPPVPIARSSKVIVADNFSADCPAMGASKILQAKPNIPAFQVGILGDLRDSGKFSEDCLTLNIWTKPQVGEKKKAVMVWIHGGGFTQGSTFTPATAGVRFAGNQDIVLVSVK